MKKLILILFAVLICGQAQSQDIFGSPAPYQEYIAIVTQSGTNPPVSNVIKNTTPYDFYWTRHDSGHYFLIPELGARPDIGTNVYTVLEWDRTLVDSTGFLGYLITDQITASSEYPNTEVFPFSTVASGSGGPKDNLLKGRGALIKIKFY